MYSPPWRGTSSRFSGAGKTLAYALPLVEWIRTEKKNKIPTHGILNNQATPYVLIITPTHELAIEVHGLLHDLCYTNGVRTILIYGGVGPETGDEIRNNLRTEGCDVLVATPGILLTYFRSTRSAFGNQTCIRLSELKFMVYDEADLLMRTHEKSFHKQVNEIENFTSTLSHDEPSHWFFLRSFMDENITRAKGLIERNFFYILYIYVWKWTDSTSSKSKGQTKMPRSAISLWSRHSQGI